MAKPQVPMKGFDEYDAFTGWRRVMHWQPGERARIKATYNRRVRRVIRRRIREREERL